MRSCFFEVPANQIAASATGNRRQEVSFTSSGDFGGSSWERPSDVESRVVGHGLSTRDTWWNPLPSRITLASEIRDQIHGGGNGFQHQTRFYLCVLTLYARSLAMLA